MLSVRDLVRQIPAEWQENVKHRSAISYARVPRADPGPGAHRPDRHVVLGGAGDPRHPRPLGPRPAARAGPPGHGAAAGRAPGPAVAALQPGLRPRRARPRPRGRAGEPVAGGARDRADAADQPRRQPGAATRRTTGRWCASCWPTRPCRSAPAHPGWRCRPTCTRGCAELAGRLGRGGPRRAATTSSATSTTSSARPPPRGSPTPTSPTRQQVADAARGRGQGAAARERPAARRRGAAAPASSTRCDRALERSYLRPTYRLREKVVRRLEASRRRPRALTAYRVARGRSSRSA